MTSHIWWYVARSTGIVAWLVLAASTIWGILQSTQFFGRAVSAKWIVDLHRFLGGLSLVFTAAHLGALVADDYVEFGALEIAVPFASSWRPVAVALGILGLYGLVVVEITSLLMRRIPRRWWRPIHLSSYVTFWLVTLHLVLAGTDARTAVLVVTTIVVAGAVVFLTLFRVLADRRSPARAVRSAGG